MRILIVLPYSGPDFGGGLAIFNAALAAGLSKAGHSVRVLTMQLPEPIAAKKADHGGAELLFIADDRSRVMDKANGSSGQADRNLLNQYLQDRVKEPAVIATVRAGGWEPDCVIGHSRFSGAAAVSMKLGFFKKAKAAYFVHSLPVEGKVLTGYEAFMETMSSTEAQNKIDKEVAGMDGADLIVPVGPLIRAGVAKIVRSTPKLINARIHECIGGTSVDEAASGSRLPPPVGNAAPRPASGGAPTVAVKPGAAADAAPLRLLFLGRASEPIKGLSDLVLAAVAIDDLRCEIDVLYWDDKNYQGTVDATTKVVPKVGEQTRAPPVTPLPTPSPIPHPTQPSVPPQGSGTPQPPPTASTAPKDTRQDSWTVDKRYAQEFLDGALGAAAGKTVKITLKDKTRDPRRTALDYHALLMPSYIEHFGLVPFDALAVGVPVLVNQLSGAAMFLSDRRRFPKLESSFVVEDFLDTKSGKAPIKPDDYLEHVKPDSFDDRHRAWAAAIRDLHDRWNAYAGDAAYVQSELKNYSWMHCGQALVLSLARDQGDTRQIASGAIEIVPRPGLADGALRSRL